jgi:hypothetical protein
MSLSSRRLFLGILLVALFVMTAREIADPDFWWHLSAGKYMVATRSVPHVDVFSGTVAGLPWVTHEWLSEIIIYALYSLGSFPVLILAFAAIITLSFAFVYARCDGKPYAAAFTLLLAALATAPTWGVRPQMISLLLTSVFLWVLDTWRSAQGAQSESHDSTPVSDERRMGEPTPYSPGAAGFVQNRRLIWFLVPLMVLWVNLHSGFALGLAILGVYVFGEAVSYIGGDAARKGLTFTGLRASPLGTLGLVFIACLVVVPLNPNGAVMYVYPFETLTSRVMQLYIQEWFSPDLHLLEFQPFAALLLATLAALGLSGKRASLTQTLLLVGSAYAALRSARNIPIFAVIAAPILAEHAWLVISSRGWARALSGAARTPRRLGLLNAVLLLVIIAAGLGRVAMVVANQNAAERAAFPAAALDFLQAQPVSGTIFDSYAWGGYVMWRLYPTARVFIDGRADVYGDAFIENEYMKAYRAEADWRTPLDRYGVHTVLVEPDAPLAAQLAQDAAWRQVYADKQAVIYER